ncbi:metal-dependent glycoprotease [Mycolicibacterium mageritense DSM 44476 = CIP 104973]|uniref:Amidohydrolase n=2 Tax=Mycolicibacterium TaxID=1866885 RepID=A0ABN5YA64_MYCME|nr:amidohydrolase [Mycolicibacterium mageritense]MBN3452549.1 amidohydrolase [Mycobacterium sp. DSM 3803]MCC9183200.1 amidohydrolase [Mycolicibacterium mageritense]CDO20464.1 amidohydrolase [Mycolicibacterium mageritense DSM 44476 = CIP 104973]BBX35019.1 amidohydrolase [Mycolicibacterium mageritense]GJJ18942.1 amidohydrolase [Mycolicibacterium mageritense]
MPAVPATIVFTGGPVLTMDSVRSRVDAVAVTGNRISAVGTAARESIGPDTAVVDLAGKLLIPGFQDAHVHPVGAGVERMTCDLLAFDDADATLAAVGAYAAAHPERPWITGGGWSLDAFDGGIPTARMLDSVVADRPAYLPNRDHHGAWVNSRALQIAGITDDTPDPPGGRIERDADGAATGMLQEAAMDLVAAHVPRPTEDELYRALLDAQNHLHSLGITAWQDAILGRYAAVPDAERAYLRAALDGTLTVRVAAAQWWERDRGAEQIAEMVERRTALQHARLRANTVKIMVDGIAENQTAAMLAPYLDGCGCGTRNAGVSFVDPEALRGYVVELDALGFQVHFHALGDRAVREALDAIEAARHANGFRDTRPHLAHLQVVDPRDIPRFRTLGAVANMQPLWACHEPSMDELTIPFLGEQRARRQYPFGDLLRAGAVLAAGSDWPVSSPDPIQGIHVAVNRRAPATTDDRVFLPEQRIDLNAAFAAYTAGSAYVNHLDETGVIRPGYLADLVVLDRDPFASPAEEIDQTRVERTYVDGELVYADSMLSTAIR